MAGRAVPVVFGSSGQPDISERDNMPDFRVPPQCRGFEMQDGTKYNPNRDGVIHVDREDHAAAIRRAPQAKHWGGGVIDWGWKYVGASGWDCHCGFSAFAWQDKCPRCERAKVEEVEVTP